MPHYKLYYPDLNARGEPCRMMFALAGVEFEDFRMKVPTSTKDRNDASYLAEPKLEVDGIVMNRNVAILRKFAKEHKAPYLTFPVLEVDGVKIGQTLAIVRYLANEFGFAGPDNLTCAVADALCDQMADYVLANLGWHVVNKGFVDGGDVAELYEQYFVPARGRHLPFFEEALSKSSTGWFANTPDVTHADVFIAASIEWLQKLNPKCDSFFDGFPLLAAHHKKFFAHPKLQKHLAQRPEVDY
ncbi:hypothetical protein PRIPAC_81038 [Pristionchus pacificus]|uniref:Glutathione S-transferase n=1 Tax=Pristionchus pacificus TaxID=54126 RepID=A0A454XR43_PRIPA|nr:hypothetical protein PRIPAC_81038 [Pristionchus pacificus]|eukprot:PDM72267.1 Glutathione S-transferase [Pristionchus pacificus]